MNFIFYDFETSGTVRYFDQILQAAAICTDENLVIKEEFDVKCRLRPFSIPDPGALLVNKIGINTLIGANKTHYEMITEMQKKFREWSQNGAHFCGYNSLYFDEEFLRQSLYQTLQPVFLTNTSGNDRGDILKALHSASCVAEPNDFKYSYNDKGNKSFKLSDFASANGIQFNAHIALEDVRATIKVAKIIKDRLPQVWESAVKCMSVQNVKDMLRNEDYFLMSYFISGKHYPFGVTYVTNNDTQGANDKDVVVLDLMYDPKDLAKLGIDKIKHYLDPPRTERKKYFRRIQINKHHILLNKEYVLKQDKYKDIGDSMLMERVRFIKENNTLREKVKLALSEIQEEKNKEKTFNQERLEPEQKIYSGGFPTKEVQATTAKFHKLLWEERFEIVDKIADDRYRQFAIRLIYEQDKNLLPRNLSDAYEHEYAKKLTEKDGIANSDYRTISMARNTIDNYREKAENMGADEKAELLAELEKMDKFLSDLEDQYQGMLQ